MCSTENESATSLIFNLEFEKRRLSPVAFLRKYILFLAQFKQRQLNPYAFSSELQLPTTQDKT